MLEIENLSKEYKVKRLTEKDVNKIYKLCSENVEFYKFCQPFVTKESILQDLKALPPKKDLKDKYYVGFFKCNKLIAILDLIAHFPNEKIAHIGFFMVRKNMQNLGVGSKIIMDLCEFLKTKNFLSVRLGYVNGNRQSECFWAKNGFNSRVNCTRVLAYDVVCVEKQLW